MMLLLEGAAARLRARISALLPPAAFLRRDRGPALFISNAPQFGFIGEIPGFDLVHSDSLLYITPSYRLIMELEASLPESGGALASSLLRFRGTEPGYESASLVCRALKLADAHFSNPIDSGEFSSKLALFERDLRRQAALCLRLGTGGGGLYLCSFLIKQKEI